MFADLDFTGKSKRARDHWPRTRVFQRRAAPARREPRAIATWRAQERAGAKLSQAPAPPLRRKERRIERYHMREGLVMIYSPRNR